MTIRESFDEGYGLVGPSRRRHRIFTEALGLPAEIEPNSFVSLDALHEIAAALRLAPGGRLVDLGCGRGGIGLWLGRELGVAVVGVDFSVVAVRQAAGRRAAFGMADRARFCVADQAATGLAAGAADAVLSIDAVQFSPDPAAVVREARRVLIPGGRYVLTNWEPRRPVDPAVPARMGALDFAGLLGAAGFTAVRVQDRPDLMRRQQQVFETSLRTDPAGDPALDRLRAEAHHVAHWSRTMRRVLVTAEAPA